MRHLSGVTERNHENLSQDSRPADRGLNSELPEHEAGLLTNRQWYTDLMSIIMKLLYLCKVYAVAYTDQTVCPSVPPYFSPNGASQKEIYIYIYICVCVCVCVCSSWKRQPRENYFCPLRKLGTAMPKNYITAHPGRNNIKKCSSWRENPVKLFCFYLEN
jgi:hypothetical protein